MNEENGQDPGLWGRLSRSIKQKDVPYGKMEVAASESAKVILMTVAADIRNAIVGGKLFDPAKGPPSQEDVYQSVLAVARKVHQTGRPAQVNIIQARINEAGNMAFSLSIGEMEGQIEDGELD